MLVFFAAVFLFFSMVARFSSGAAYGALRFRLRLEGARAPADLRVGAIIPNVGLGLFMDRQVQLRKTNGFVLGDAK